MHGRTSLWSLASLLAVFSWEGVPGGSVVKESACPCSRHRRCGFSLGQEDLLEDKMANPLRYSCLENPMDRGAWWATVHGVTELDKTEPLSVHTFLGKWERTSSAWYLFLQAYCQKHTVSLKKKIIGRRKERRKEGREVKEGIEGERKACKLNWGQKKQGFSLNTLASFPATLSFSSYCLSHPIAAPKLGSTFSTFQCSLILSHSQEKAQGQWFTC